MGIVLDLIVLVAVGAGIVAWVRSRRVGGPGLEPPEYRRGGLAVAGGVVLYAIAFAGLLAVLYALSGLLAILLGVALQRAGALLAAGDMRGRASFSLAALIVGLPLWLGIWTALGRRVARHPVERDAGERRLFLAAARATTAIVALFALQDLLRFALTWPGPAASRPAPLDGVAAGARLLVYGLAFACYARLYRREHDPRGGDDAHDLAVYVVAAFGLGFLVAGLDGAIHELAGDLLRLGQPTLLGGQGSAWAVWGPIAAPLLAGALVWGLARRYDLWRGGRRPLRVAYLYIALAVAVAAALGAGADGAYELLRRAFGYRPAEGAWIFLPDVLPPLLLGGAGWAYHWRVVRRQDALPAADGGPGLGDADGVPAGALSPARRPGLALLTAAGLAMLAPAVIALLWVGLDAILRIGGALAGADWWRDRLSVGMAAAAIGFVAWLAPWSVLQRAATRGPARERAARERRLLLGGAAVLGALAAIGFTVALLWLALRALLGERLDAAATGDALKDLCAALVLAALTLAHGLMLRRDLRLAGPGAALSRPRVIALLVPDAGAEEVLAGLRSATGLRIDVAGYLSASEAALPGDLDALRDGLLAAARMDSDAHAEGALVVVGPTGGQLYLYTRSSARPATQTVPVPAGPRENGAAAWAEA